MPLEYHRLLETAVNSNATEVWLVTGRPPLLRIERAFRPLAIPALTTEEIESIVWKVDEPAQKFYRENGVADFPVAYGKDQATFVCSVVKNETSAFLVLRRVATTSQAEPPAATTNKPLN